MDVRVVIKGLDVVTRIVVDVDVDVNEDVGVAENMTELDVATGGASNKASTQ
jgi:hypothetical protein